MPTAYFPIAATFGGRALLGVVAVMAGAVTLAPAVNTPATSTTPARRARQRRGLRASIIVPLRSFGRSPHLLLKRRYAGLVGIVAEPLERALVVLQVAVEEVQCNVRDGRWLRVRSAAIRRGV